MLNMQLKDMEPESIAMEMQKRVKRMDSKEMEDIAKIFANCNKDCFELQELCEMFSKTRQQINHIITNLRSRHGLDIINLSKSGVEGRYKMIGFKAPDNKRRKCAIKYTKEMMRLKLLGQVFC